MSIDYYIEEDTERKSFSDFTIRIRAGGYGIEVTIDKPEKIDWNKLKQAILSKGTYSYYGTVSIYLNKDFIVLNLEKENDFDSSSEEGGFIGIEVPTIDFLPIVDKAIEIMELFDKM